MKIKNIILLLSVLFSLASKANVLGNMQTFAPNPDSLIFQNIHSSSTLTPGYFNIGLFAAYVRNQLSTYDNLVTPKYLSYKDQSATFDVIFAWGIWKGFEFTYNMPGYISQNADSGQTRTNTISQGVNGHRPGIKYSFSQSKTGGLAVAASVDFVQTLDNPYVGNSPGQIYNLEFAWDLIKDKHGYGINIGYRNRPTGSIPATAYFFPVRDQAIASLGYVYGLNNPTRYHIELFASRALSLNEHPDYKYISSMEVLLGMKHRFARNFWGHLGATAEALADGLAPDFRVYAGLNYYFGSAGKEEKQPTETNYIQSPLSVQPSEAKLAYGENQKFEIQGGTPPYETALSAAIGEWDPEQLNYTAAQRSGNLSLIVTDQAKQKVFVPITIGKGKSSDAEALQVIPPALEVFEGGEVPFDVVGGQPEYTLRLSKPFGSVDPTQYVYDAPPRPGKVDLIVEDGNGSQVVVPIKVIPVPKAHKTITLTNLEFDFNTANLTKSSKATLDRNLAQLSKVNVRRIIVSGHTDNVGSDEYNLSLSRKRAKTVALMLKARLDLEANQVQYVGYGESQPIATNKTDKGRQTNRRVDLKIYYNNQADE